MACRIAGLDLSLAGTAAVVLSDDGSPAAMLAYSSVAKDFKNNQGNPMLKLIRSESVCRGDIASDFNRTAGVASALEAFLHRNLVTTALVGIEDHAFGAKGASVYQLGHLHGMVRRDIVRSGFRFALLNVKEVKIAATGKGNADKSEMVNAVGSAMSLKGFSAKLCEALADAYAVARLTFWISAIKSGKSPLAMPGDIAALVSPRPGKTSIMSRQIVG